ncbi:hypothetical protein L1987_83093 [Smallanthus sonchifolius]|uniref:Uncharacterized protein n=1 Tax=Smallanthus sonchifolius TaxID=185202 RepID=A0ACB8YBF9_9ASTR|nr:hypothetical protein L1987_83093 [Smallanthus sonchifolius]
MQRYELGKLLGQGNFAKVYHGRNLETGVNVAIKITDKDRVLKVGMMDRIKREIAVMKLVKHANVVQLYEVMASKTKIYFVLEYVKGVSKMLDSNPKTRISIANIMENSWFKKGLVSQPPKLEKTGFDLEKAENLNAFDIISLSPGFDLSGLFKDNVENEKEVRFICRQMGRYIIMKVEEIAKSFNMKIACNVHLVEPKQLGGDRVEFHEIMNERIRPALMDML